MRGTIVTVVASMWLAGGAVAQSAPQDGPAACTPGPDKLGVSRIVEIDTAGGPVFGQMQYGHFDFLADGEVVLTFDDGPLRRYTLAVLAALEAHCAKATFFVVGRMAVADPEVLKETARRGHTVATHTWSHRNLRGLGAAAAEKEIELGISAASLALAQPVAPFFRFPYLADSKSALAHLKTRNVGVFSIDIDTKDFRTRSASLVQRRVLAGLEEKKKGIILFHDIQVSTVRALLGLLAELKTRGYKLVHLTAKAPVTTLPDHDATAERELARKMLAGAQPLADRSLVWPMKPDDDEKLDAPVKKRKRPKSRPAAGEDESSVGSGKATRPETASDNAGDVHLRLLRQ